MYDIPLMKPLITDRVKQKVLETLESGYLTEGPVTWEFEQRVAEYCGASHCLAVTSCTTGLELSLRALGIGPGDEIIVPDYTYPATASAVAIVGATPVIVDVDPHSMLIDYDLIETAITPRTKGVIPVSLFGNPLDWKRLNIIKRKHGLFMIEDAACALGAEYAGCKVGIQADITVFSLHPRKFITTGEGGLVCTENSNWAEWMQSFKHFGMAGNTDREQVKFVRMGSNHKLSNVLAAIGLAQMDEIDTMLERRRELAEQYVNLLAKNGFNDLQQTTQQGKHSYQSFGIKIKNRDKILQTLRNKGIEAQIGTYALNMHPAFNIDNMKFFNSQILFETVLVLPMYYGMGNKDQTHIINKFLEAHAQSN